MQHSVHPYVPQQIFTFGMYNICPGQAQSGGQTVLKSTIFSKNSICQNTLQNSVNVGCDQHFSAKASSKISAKLDCLCEQWLKNAIKKKQKNSILTIAYSRQIQTRNPPAVHYKAQYFQSWYNGTSHCLEMSYYVNFLGGLGSNEFHIK